jgi:hypothetical protein
LGRQRRVPTNASSRCRRSTSMSSRFRISTTSVSSMQ